MVTLVKDPQNVALFKDKIRIMNIQRTGINKDIIVNRLHEAIANGWRVEYHVDGKVYR